MKLKVPNDNFLKVIERVKLWRF